MVDEYLWLVVCAGLVMFVVAFGIGANDVANAFATSVGSRALTFRQAIILAGIFEFVGAVGLGAEVTKTISGGIASASTFKHDPDVFMYGMLCAAVAAGVWLLLATYWALPVSTTHSIIGGVIGFALAYKGNSALIWWDKIHPAEFPYRKGLGVIILGWAIAPTACALVASMLFFLVRGVVLRSKHSIIRAIYSLPILVAFAFFVNFYFLLYKGVKGVHEFSRSGAAWAAAIAAALGGVLTGCLVPFLLKKERDGTLKTMNFDGDGNNNTIEEGVAEKAVAAPVTETAAPSGFLAKAKAGVLHSIDYDIHKAVAVDEQVAALHANAEVFDGRAEGLYSYAQIFTACCVSFAHGANDVANAAGPFAAIYQVYRTAKVPKDAESPRWIQVIGGLGIVLGLALYGYNVMAALGVHSIKMTPSRGFLIEVTTALVVTVGSGYGLPLSTTHSQVGGTWGVGLLEGSGGVNMKLAVKFIGGWIMTLLVAGGASAALFAQGVYSPTLQSEIKG